MTNREKEEHNKKIIMKFFTINTSEVTEIDIRKFTNNEVYIQSILTVRRSFPDYTIMMEDITAEDDFVITHSVARGTHSTEFYGIPATFKTVEFQIIIKYQIVNDIIVNAWPMYDSLILMEQLGVLNEPIKGT